jgi:hypothetical protein
MKSALHSAENRMATNGETIMRGFGWVMVALNVAVGNGVAALALAAFLVFSDD